MAQPTSSHAAPPAVSRPRAWLLAARPKTLPAALSPVVVGAALAWAAGSFRPLPVLAAALGALLLQIGSNFANDYFDYFHGADTHERLGPTRVTATGLIRPAELRWGMVVVFGLAALVGVYLIWVGGWPIFAIGVAAILAAVAYTGGPFPFGYYGLGDLFVFLFFGLAAVGGTYRVQALRHDPPVLPAAAAVGLLVTNILVVNNLRDIDTDRAAGKRTLAVMVGRRATRLEYTLFLAAAYLIPPAGWGAGWWGTWALLSWLTLPLAWRSAVAVWTVAGRPLNATLAATARVALLFSLLFALGIALG